jgi:hypothetical protein
MKRVRLLFIGREQDPSEDVPAFYVVEREWKCVCGKKWKCDFLHPLTLLIAWFECRETVSAAPPDALN